MKKLVVFGTSAFAKIAHYYFKTDSTYDVVAFTVDRDYLIAPIFEGLPVVAFDEVSEKYPSAENDMFVAVGIQNVNRTREEKACEAEAKGYRLASFMSSKADVASDLELQPNSMIMERAGIQPFVKIGRNTIIWSSSRIGFESTIGDHCWIVGAVMGESVKIADNVFIGLNATIAPSVSIGKSNIIGAGALILRDTGDFEVYPGTASQPSRVPSHRVNLR